MIAGRKYFFTQSGNTTMSSEVASPLSKDSIRVEIEITPITPTVKNGS